MYGLPACSFCIPEVLCRMTGHCMRLLVLLCMQFFQHAQQQQAGIRRHCNAAQNTVQVIKSPEDDSILV